MLMTVSMCWCMMTVLYVVLLAMLMGCADVLMLLC
jgi:hypothetical protein